MHHCFLRLGLVAGSVRSSVQTQQANANSLSTSAATDTLVAQGIVFTSNSLDSAGSSQEIGRIAGIMRQYPLIRCDIYYSSTGHQSRCESRFWKICRSTAATDCERH